MIRNKAIFQTAGTNLILKSLQWAQEFDYFSYFNPNGIDYPFDPFDHFICLGNRLVLQSPDNLFDRLRDRHSYYADWLVGFLGYDLKNQLEDLESNNPDFIKAPDALFYQPDHLIFWRENEVEIHTPKDPKEIFRYLKSLKSLSPKTPTISKLEPGMSHKEYLDKVGRIKEHIVNGDLYEVNLCIEFTAHNTLIDPLTVYQDLNQISPMPFSSFHRFKDLFIISASPERFLKKEGNRLISQPIKGTIQRGSEPSQDQIFKEKLAKDEKERAENMMIVDLVRNDLSRSSVPGSVQVNELFGIYSFEYVHQMISTVSSQIESGKHFTEAIQCAFPMGSMTGAPKIKAMEIIENYENNKRGIYSGAGGFITPSGDFDLAVIIRSIIYHHTAQKLSFEVGSAITYDSNPEKEYQECLLKARPIFEALGQEWPGLRSG